MLLFGYDIHMDVWNELVLIGLNWTFQVTNVEWGSIKISLKNLSDHHDFCNGGL